MFSSRRLIGGLNRFESESVRELFGLKISERDQDVILTDMGVIHKIIISPAMIGAAIILLLGILCTKSTVDCNDGTRMAVVECLVDYGTFAIDRSGIKVVFDKIVINGDTYSDKPLFLSTMVSPVYALLKLCGCSFSSNFRLTVYLINLLTINLLNILNCWERTGFRVEKLFLVAIGLVLAVYLTITGDFGGWAYGFRYFIPAVPILWVMIFLDAPLERTGSWFS